MSNYFFRPVLRDLTKGARLEFARKFRYLDEKNVAEELGLGGKDLARTIRDYERNATKPLPGRLEELTDIVKRTARVLDIPIDTAALELAKRSRETPRIANRLFKRVRDFAMVEGNGTITLDITNEALNRLKVDKMGLDNTDRDLLLAIINRFNGGPVGVEALSSSIGEEVTTIEDVYEPYLLQMGLLKRTARGRVVTDKAYEVLGIEKKTKDKKTGNITHKHFTDIIDYLEEGDFLVLNDTKVLPARIIGVKEDTGAVIELLLLKNMENDLWECLVKPARRIKVGTIVSFGNGELKARCTKELDEGIRHFELLYGGYY